MSPNQADDSDDYTVIESAPHVIETFNAPWKGDFK